MTLDILRVRRDSRFKTVIPTFKQPEAVPDDEEDDEGGGLKSVIFGVLSALDKPRGAAIGALSGENPLESLSNIVAGWKDPEKFSGRNIGFVRFAPDEDIIGEFSLRDILGGVGDVAFDPITIATAGAGGPLSAGLKGTKGLRRLAPLVEPIINRPKFASRLAAETAVGVGAIAGGAAAAETGLPGAQIVGGLAGALVTAGGIGTLDALERSARASALEAADPRIQEFGRGAGQDLTARQTAPRGIQAKPDAVDKGRSIVTLAEAEAEVGTVSELFGRGELGGFRPRTPEHDIRFQLLKFVEGASQDPRYTTRLTERSQTLVDKWFHSGNRGRDLRDQVRADTLGFQELYKAGQALRDGLRMFSTDGKTIVLFRGDKRLNPVKASGKISDSLTPIDADIVQSYTVDPRVAQGFSGFTPPLDPDPNVFKGTRLGISEISIERRVVNIDDIVAPGAGIEAELIVLQPGRARGIVDFPFRLSSGEPMFTEAMGGGGGSASNRRAELARQFPEENIKNLDALVEAGDTAGIKLIISEKRSQLKVLEDKQLSEIEVGTSTGVSSKELQLENEISNLVRINANIRQVKQAGLGDFPEQRTTFSDEEGLIAIRAEGEGIEPPERGLALREGEPAAATRAETRVRPTVIEAVGY
ncbi:hypothetical protein LCGC14_0740540, partial [marine sediment metagenome]